MGIGIGIGIDVPPALRGIPLDDAHPVGHPGAGGAVPGEGDQGRIELDQQRRDLGAPRMGRHHVDDVTPLARAQAHYPDGLWMGATDAPPLGPTSSRAARSMDCTARSRSDRFEEGSS